MKKICIVYSSDHYTEAETINIILHSSGYSSFLVGKDYKTVFDSVAMITQTDCQMIISVDGFGFEKPSVDGGSYYNKTPVNVLAILLDNTSIHRINLQQRINYTVSFLVPTIKDVNYIKSNFKHIYHVDSYSSLDDLPSYLENLDWRF